MIKICSLPTRRRVADRAVGGEPGRRVVGVGGFLVVRQMAGSTIARCACKTAVNVALCASDIDVRPRQRKGGERVVIERRGSPIRRVVTDRAVLRKARLDVVRVLRTREVFQMATHAGGARHVEIPIQVAGRAIQRGVHAGQYKAGEFTVVEICP